MRVALVATNTTAENNEANEANEHLGTHGTLSKRMVMHRFKSHVQSVVRQPSLPKTVLGGTMQF
eukprot:10528562-Alexandrium_andersonii.AAC.1